MPQFHKELNNYSVHLSLAEDCNNSFSKITTKIKQICEAEQNLVIGTDQNGENIKDPMRLIIPLLSDNDVKMEDKLRLLILFLMNKSGITEKHLQKLLNHSGMTESNKKLILNLKSIGIKVLADETRVSVSKLCSKQNLNIRDLVIYRNPYHVVKIFLKIDESVVRVNFS